MHSPVLVSLLIFFSSSSFFLCKLSKYCCFHTFRYLGGRPLRFLIRPILILPCLQQQENTVSGINIHQVGAMLKWLSSILHQQGHQNGWLTMTVHDGGFKHTAQKAEPWLLVSWTSCQCLYNHLPHQVKRERHYKVYTRTSA